MSEPARAAAAQPSSIEDRRAARKPTGRPWEDQWLPEVLKRYPDLDANEVAVLRVLADRADNATGGSHGYQRGIAKAIRRGPRTVRRSLRKLERRGLIVYTPGKHRRGERLPDPCRFRLVPLEEVRSPCPEGAVTVSAPGPGQPDLEVRSPCPEGAVTVSALTAVRTTQRTEPPQPPAGGRERDRERWLGELRQWAIADGDLPLEHFDHIVCAVARRRGRTHEQIVAELERLTPWRPPPAAIDVRDVADVEPSRGPGGDGQQLELPW